MKVLSGLLPIILASMAPSVDATAAGPAAPKSIYADQSIAGSAVDLATDSMLVLRLPVSPSTGYRWEIVNPSEVAGVVREADLSPEGPGAPHFEFDGQKPMPGGYATQLIHLIGARAGTANVMLGYRRPWQAGYGENVRFSVRSKGAFAAALPQVQRKAPMATQAPSIEELYAPGLPAHFDWREQGIVTPVRDQEYCGSCWAFGATAAVEAKIWLKDGVQRDFSEQYLVSCNMHGFGCGGGWWSYDYYWMTSLPAETGGGARFEADFPYKGEDVPCNPPHTPREQIEGWAYTDDIADGAIPYVDHRPTIAQIKEKIYNYGPIGTDVCSSTWGSYTGGIFRSDCTTPTHIVAITGWDDAEGVFYIKNSWGTSWGESGYMRLAYNVCLVGHNSTYVLYEKTNPRIRYRRDTFFEDKPNNGSIYNKIDARIEDSTSSTQFKVTSGNMILGTHYTVANLPAGLSLVVQATSTTTALLSISGNAPSHGDANDVSNLTVSFLNAAFTGNSAAAVEDSTYSKLKINFNDPYRLVYFDPPDVYINYAHPWEFYWLEGSNYQYSFGLWWYDGVYEPDPNNQRTLKFESYTRPVLSLGATPPANIKYLNYGDVIGPTSTIWAPGGTYGDQHTLAGPAHNAFKGRTGYLGFTFEYNGWPVYGWVRVSVSSDGSWGQILDYAWNQDPNKTLRAGYTTDTSTAPVAAFAGTPTSVAVGGSVQFTDQSTGSPTSWSWSFPGGTPSTSTAQNPLVRYNTAGTYNVTLTATNASGSNTLTKTGYITVSNTVLPPVANFTASTTTVSVGGSVTFTDTSTNNPTSWSWTFPGGTPSTSTTRNPTVTYNTAGTYSVTLQATNSAGSNTLTKTNYITVSNTPVPPVNYCTASHLYNYGYISNVRVGSINNTTSWGTNGYADYTAQSTNMTAGTGYTITVTGYNQHWPRNSLGIWVDWNQDGDWVDSGETIYTAIKAGPYSATIRPPTMAKKGTTRMRVRLMYDKTATPCGADNYFGDIEDYSIVVQ